MKFKLKKKKHHQDSNLGQCNRRHSPYVVDHANTAYQTIKFTCTIDKVLP